MAIKTNIICVSVGNFIKAIIIPTKLITVSVSKIFAGKFVHTQKIPGRCFMSVLVSKAFNFFFLKWLRINNDPYPISINPQNAPPTIYTGSIKLLNFCSLAKGIKTIDSETNKIEITDIKNNFFMPELFITYKPLSFIK